MPALIDNVMDFTRGRLGGGLSWNEAQRPNWRLYSGTSSRSWQRTRRIA
jgi:hypothetical protein